MVAVLSQANNTIMNEKRNLKKKEKCHTNNVTRTMSHEQCHTNVTRMSYECHRKNVTPTGNIHKLRHTRRAKLTE